jgi:hypothetical protein
MIWAKKRAQVASSPEVFPVGFSTSIAYIGAAIIGVEPVLNFPPKFVSKSLQDLTFT